MMTRIADWTLGLGVMNTTKNLDSSKLVYKENLKILPVERTNS